MSLSAATSTALSGLSTSQAGLRATANNITNVNTEGYDRRVVELQSRLLGNVGAGVEVADIKRVVDQFLEVQLLGASSESSRYQVMVTAFERLEAVLGAPEDNSSFNGRLDKLFVTIGAMAMEPDSMIRRKTAVIDIQTWGDEVSRLADKIQELRKDADREIVTAIADVNAQTKRIFDLNSQIVVEQKLGRTSATLEEQRGSALSKLAEYMDISTFSMSSGLLGVTGARGMVLVDSGYRALEYTPAGTISTATQFSQIEVKKVDKDTGLTFGTGSAFDPNRTSGRLDGLLTIRDVTLPNFSKSLGEMAGGVVDQLNGVHNNSIAVPPLTTMTGRNTGLISTDVMGFTGEMTFAALDASDNYAARVVVDFDAMTINNGGGAVAIGGTGSIGDFVTAMNGASGFNGAATLAFSTGQMTFAVGTAAGVGTIQDATDPSLRGGRGFSHFFGLNDLVGAVEPPHFDTGLTAASTHSLIAGKTTTLQFKGPENQVAVSFDLTTTNINLRGTTLQSVLDELNSTTAMGNYVTFALNSAGAMVATPAAGFEAYSIVATSDTSARGNSNQSLTDLFGLGDKYVMDAARTVKVIDAITAEPVKMALGQLDVSAGAIAGTIPAISAGDNRGAVALHQTANASVNFSAAGGLAAVSSTLSDYAGSVIADIANSGAIVEQLGMDRTAYEEEIKARVSDVSGVNIDEEMANMILFQNAFSAAARIVATVQEMYDDLMRVV